MAKQPFPTTFGTLASGPQPAALIDGNFAVVARGASVTVIGTVPFWNDIGGTDLSVSYPTNPPFGTLVALVGLDGSGKLPPVDGSNLTNLPEASTGVPIRQTVLGGPTDANGLPSFLPATTTATLVLSTQNVSSTAPLVATAANGFSAAGQVDRTGGSTGNVSWTLPASSTSYLYLDIASNGSFTPGNTTLAPVYQNGGTYSVTNGQFTFNITQMSGEVGSGAAAAQTFRVFVGEAVTDGTQVSSTVMYAYQGRYDSGFTATLPTVNTALPGAHNLGTKPENIDFVLECLTTEQGYAVGDRLYMGNITGDAPTNDQLRPSLSATRLGWSYIQPGDYTLVNKATGANGALTLANWRYKITAQRGW